MARVDWPVHFPRLAVAFAIVGFVWLVHGIVSSSAGLLLWVVIFTVGVLVWQGSQHAARPKTDGLLLGLILGAGFGSVVGFQAYQASDICIFFECEKDVAAFWTWAIPIFLVETLLGLSVGSMGVRREGPIPGFEDLEGDKEGMPPLPDRPR